MNSPVVTPTLNDWEPVKPADDYSDDEIRLLPFFKGLHATLPAMALPLSRNAIAIAWAEKQAKSPRRKAVDALFVILAAENMNDDRYVVGKDGSVTPLRPAGRAAKPVEEGGRCSGKDYAKFIGKGNNHAAQQHGGFVREVSGRSLARSGIIELVIGPPLPGSNVPYSAKLYQRPVAGAEAPVISYPPVNPDNLVSNQKIVEVRSISHMMRKSFVQTNQTPIVYFNLRDILKGSPKS